MSEREPTERSPVVLQIGSRRHQGWQEVRIRLSLEQIADSGVTPAERLLELYETRWNRDAGRVFDDFAY